MDRHFPLLRSFVRRVALATGARAFHDGRRGAEVATPTPSTSSSGLRARRAGASWIVASARAPVTALASVASLASVTSVASLPALPLGGAVVVAAAAASLAATQAGAQAPPSPVAAPVSVRRLDRLCRAYLSPSDAELDAIDAAHRKALDEYDATLASDARALRGRLQETVGDPEAFARLLAEVDSFEARLAELEARLLQSIGDAVGAAADPARAQGLARLRDARERDRLAGGLTRLAPTALGGTGAVVDLADLLADPALVARVPAESRESFDRIVRETETRALAAARTARIESQRALSAGMRAVAESAGGPAAAQAAVAAGAVGLRAAMRSAHAANRATLDALAEVLPDAVVSDLRTEVALREIGPMRFGLSADPTAEVGDAVRRVLRDPAADAATRDAARAIAADWRAARREALERLASIAVNGAASPEESAAIATEARDAVVAADEAAAAKLASALGALADAYLAEEERVGPNGVARLAWAPRRAAPTPQDELEAEAARGGGLSTGRLPEAFEPRTLRRAADVAGLERAQWPVIESLLADWTESQWTPRVSPSVDRERSAAARVISPGPGGRVLYDDSAIAERDAARRTIASAMLELDAALAESLAAALAIEPNDPFLLLLRLERVPLLQSQGVGGDAGVPLSPAAILAEARLPAGVARRVVAERADQWREFIEEMPALLATREARRARIVEAERAFGSGDSARVERGSRDYVRLLREIESADAELGARVAALLDEGAAEVLVDEDDRRRVRIARLRTSFPGVYRASDSLERELDRACALPGLSDEQVARLELLRSDYGAMYETLSAAMVVPAFEAIPGDGGEEAWRDFAERRARAADLRARRDEETERARLRAQRILGLARAGEVPGLAPDADERRIALRRKGVIDPFAEDHD
ncbi:MAG: hypothetical protein RI967_2562 [Planctomycetota bacterium]